MDWSGDDLAGIVDCFGTLPRERLVDAAAELAFKAGDEPDEEAIDAAIEAAIDRYRLVVVDDRLAAGPTAFPTPPDGSDDLPHILDVDPEPADTERIGRAVEERFRAEAASVAAEGDANDIERLVDLSYDIEASLPVDLTAARDRLRDAAGDASESAA